MDRSWEYINHSQKHECGNWGRGRAIPRKGIYKRNCSCSACSINREEEVLNFINTGQYLLIVANVGDLDPGSIFYDPLIQDGKIRIRDPKTGITISGHISESLETICGLKLLKFFVNSVLKIRILNGKIQNRNPG